MGPKPSMPNVEGTGSVYLTGLSYKVLDEVE